jgi:type VI secretion system secreted protein VgrG
VSSLEAAFHLQGDSLPSDAIPIRYKAFEAISQPYSIEVELYTEDTGFDVEQCLRKRLLLTVIDAKGGTRLFDGVVDHASFVGYIEPRLYFRMRLRPALAALGHREGSRIFQNKSIQEIAQKIFDDAGFGDKVEWDLAGTYEPREFVVQYCESELNFVSRLFEDAGIFYFFKHSPDGHTLVVADSTGAFVLEDGAPPVQFSLTQGAAGQPIHDIVRKRSLRTSAVRMRDYDFEKPAFRPESSVPYEERWPMSHYEYPGGFVKQADGKQRAAARMRELRRDADMVQGTSEAIGLRCGVPFQVDGAAEGCVNGEFVVVELSSSGQQLPEKTDPAAPNFGCRNEFHAIPKDMPYAPRRTAKRPRIRGLQTAVVTGSGQSDQSIHVDKYGRIKVRFFWDRIGQQDENSSCWVRVSQVGMGGSMFLPRVGWEVSVAFLDGDPDRPVVLGCLYNAEKTTPYGLPGAKASGAIKSLSSPGGAGHNEIKMADDGGTQGFAIHAQKDLNITTGHDRNEKVAVDETHNVKVNMSTSVGSNESIQVGANQSVDVGANLSHHIGGSQSVSVGGNDTTNSTANLVENITGDRSYTIGGKSMALQNGIRVEAKGDFNRDVGAVQITGALGAISDNITGAYSSNAGAVTVHLVNGTDGETIGGAKTQQSAAAEVHLVSGSFQSACSASVTNLIGGLHYQKLGGDVYFKAPMVTLLGAVGVFKGGGSTVKLGGGPIVMTGSKIAIKTPMLVKLGSSLKLGS